MSVFKIPRYGGRETSDQIISFAIESLCLCLTLICQIISNLHLEIISLLPNRQTYDEAILKITN